MFPQLTREAQSGPVGMSAHIPIQEVNHIISVRILPTSSLPCLGLHSKLLQTPCVVIDDEAIFHPPPLHLWKEHGQFSAQRSLTGRSFPLAPMSRTALHNKLLRSIGIIKPYQKKIISNLLMSLIRAVRI
jgi:hypothetical protein